MRREMRRCSGGSSDRADSEETAVMGSSCQRPGAPRPRVRRSGGRWLSGAAVPYTGSPGAVDPATGVPRIHPRARRCRGEVRGPGPWAGPKGCSSIGRAAVSKTAGCRFKSCHPCRHHHTHRRSLLPERPPPRGERGAVSDETQGRDDDATLSDAELTDEQLDAEAPGVDDAAELEAAEDDVAAEAEEDEDKVVAPARRRRGRITAEDDEDDDEPAPRARRAARESTPSRPATRSGSGTRSRAAAEKARAQETRQRRSLRRFLREVVAELRKVIWPGRRELITYTTVVIIFVAFIVALVAGLDVLFAKGVLAVFG